MTTSQRILIIEDDRAVAATVGDGLRSAGYETTWARSGADGLTAARTTPPHLIILDVQLPDGLGFDVCRQLREAGIHVPILMLTVRHEMVDKVLGLEMGADDYLTKPFAWPELLSRIRALLRRAYGQFAGGGDHVFLGDLVIDLAGATVSRDETPINLTPTEFRLLTYLARHPGQVLSRTQLLDAVWGYDSAAENEHVVNVYIHRLRDKVETDPSQPRLILTVPGRGYRLQQPRG